MNGGRSVSYTSVTLPTTPSVEEDEAPIERLRGRLKWLKALRDRRDRPVVLLLELCNRFSLAHHHGPANGSASYALGNGNRP